MTYRFRPQGVCSRQMQVELQGHVIERLTVSGGCSGNLQGLARLVEGMRAEDAIARLKGIRCGERSTSCPDQLARGLEEALKNAE